MLCFQVIRCFMGAVDRPKPAMWITLAAIPVNTMLVYLLIYGDIGLPRLELFGAGLATTLVNSGTLLASLWFATKRRPFCDYHVLAHLWRFDWPLMRQLIVIGTPISIASLFGSGLYSAAALLAGRISTSALCAHQIAATLYMISFGISTAATVRVGHAVGCNDGPGIKRAGGVTMLFGAVIVAILALAVIAARFEIAQFFLGNVVTGRDETIRQAAKLLSIGAIFFVSEAVQTIAAGSLRGLKDTRVPLLFAGISYWLIGFSLSYVLSSKVGLDAIGIWIGLLVGATVQAGLLVLRFQQLANRLAVQSQYLST